MCLFIGGRQPDTQKRDPSRGRDPFFSRYAWKKAARFPRRAIADTRVMQVFRLAGRRLLQPSPVIPGGFHTAMRAMREIGYPLTAAGPHRSYTCFPLGRQGAADIKRLFTDISFTATVIL
jgi:hypothetical protein